MTKRWLLMFVACLLPLQVSWAAVTAYCQHEQGVEAAHFAHHEHEHHANHPETDEDKTIPGAPHADCSHSHAVNWIPALALSQSQLFDGVAVQHFLPVHFPPDFFPEALYRPPLPARA